MQKLKFSNFREKSELRKELQIYTDGACRGNGGLGARASYAFVCYNPAYEEVGDGGWCGKHTNNTGELLAIYHAAQWAGDRKAVIYSDSQYAINSLTKWNIERKKKGKQKKNYSLIKTIQEELQGKDIRLEWVKGHQESGKHVYGNTNADFLANDYLGLASYG